MKFAAATDGTRIAATPGAVATCPTCAGEVIAKCGEINIWHWAHRASDCDPAVFLDLGDYYKAHDPILLLLKFMGRKAPYGGCGNVVAAREFVRDSRNRHNNALYDCENQKQPATGVQVETTTERKN